MDLEKPDFLLRFPRRKGGCHGEIVLVEKRDDHVHLELTISPQLLTFAHIIF